LAPHAPDLESKNRRFNRVSRPAWSRQRHVIVAPGKPTIGCTVIVCPAGARLDLRIPVGAEPLRALTARRGELPDQVEGFAHRREFW
jgi:hypothetical protein